MISDGFFYELVLLGLLWLCIMWQWRWPSARVTPGLPPPTPATSPRQRSGAPKPFPGLTRTPPCAACEQAHQHGPQPPGGPPPRLVPTWGRPRQVDTSFHFCPACEYHRNRKLRDTLISLILLCVRLIINILYRP